MRLFLLFLLLSTSALANKGGIGKHPVKAYVKKSGTYVPPHYAKNPKVRR